VNRKAVALCSAWLIILQMVVVPIASAISGAAGHEGCDHGGAVHAWHADDDCGDGSQSQYCPGSRQNHSRHTGHCGCVHTGPQTQAVASSLAIFTPIAQSEALASEPEGPAFSAPVLELLRPPD
jgi:hypothetical protein